MRVHALECEARALQSQLHGLAAVVEAKQASPACAFPAKPTCMGDRMGGVHELQVAARKMRECQRELLLREKLLARYASNFWGPHYISDPTLEREVEQLLAARARSRRGGG
jgi:hypothetical protein